MSFSTLNCVNSFLLSLVLILAMTKWANRLGLIDIPSSTKTHEGQIPMVGAAMFLAFCGAAVLLQPQPPGLANLLLGLLPIVVLGIVDDLIDLRALVKLAAQCVCVSILVFPARLLIHNVGEISAGQPFLLGAWAAPGTIFAMVELVNAINMIDGLDGLAGGVSLIAFAWFGAAAAILGLSDELSIILVLVSVVLGFLFFNLRHPWRTRASVFMGDAGSMMLGLCLAYVAIDLSQRGGGSLSPIAVLWVLALPTVDTVSLTVRRVASGKGWLSSDRRHLHDLLREAGLNANTTVLVMLAITAGLGGIGIGGWYFDIPDSVMLATLAVPVLLHTWFVTVGYKWSAVSRNVSLLDEATSPLHVRLATATRPRHSAAGGGQR